MDEHFAGSLLLIMYLLPMKLLKNEIGRMFSLISLLGRHCSPDMKDHVVEIGA